MCNFYFYEPHMHVSSSCAVSINVVVLSFRLCVHQDIVLLMMFNIYVFNFKSRYLQVERCIFVNKYLKHTKIKWTFPCIVHSASVGCPFVNCSIIV